VAALVPDRVGEAAAVLARSFLDNPLLAHTFADERLRDRALRLLFAGLCRDALPFGHVDAAAVDGRMLGLRCGFRLAPIGCPWDDGSASPRRFFGSFRSTLEAPGECSAWMPHRAAFTPRNITGSYRRSEWTGGFRGRASGRSSLHPSWTTPAPGGRPVICTRRTLAPCGSTVGSGSRSRETSISFVEVHSRGPCGEGRRSRGTVRHLLEPIRMVTQDSHPGTDESPPRR